MTVPTIVCPLCGTQQPNAWDCAACGHPLHERPPQEVEVATLEELDTGRVSDAGDVAPGLIPELESTSLPAAPEPAAERLPEMETTAISGPVEVAEDAMPDLERTTLAVEEPTAAAGAVACRYCGTPWQPGSSIFCARCGMRIPAPQALPRPAEPMSLLVICPGCGTPGQTLGARCASCGQKVLAIG